MPEPILTEDQVNDAIRQLTVHCRLLMEQYEAGVGEYEIVSARGVLYTLGFEESDTDQILEHIAAGGFSYCLDSQIGDKPPRDACYWGADQLESRLRCLSNVPRVVR